MRACNLACAFALCISAAPLCHSQSADAAACQGESEFFRLKQRLAALPELPRPGSLAAEYAQLLRDHPGDPRFLYLHGRSLIGKNTQQALAELEQAAALAPDMPWTYAALARIYASRMFTDHPKSLQNARRYRQLCPANLDGFEYLDQVAGAAESGAWARELRPLLEKAAVRGLPYWRKLWAAEFRAVKEPEYETVRARVAADLARLETLTPRGRTLLGVLFDGYGLAGRKEDAARIEAVFKQDQECHIAEEAAGRRLRLHENLTPAQREPGVLEYARLTREWVRKWPDSRLAWSIRLMWIKSEPGSTKEELEQAGERSLALDKEAEMGWTSVPMDMRVAQAWTRGGIRLEDSVRMAEAALDQLSLGPEEMSDLVYPAAKVAEIGKAQQFGFDVSTWDCMTVIVDAADQLNDFDKVHRMLQRMRQWLKDNEFKKDDSTAGFPMFEGRYLQSAARSAEAEGHRLDALALYTKAMACCAFPDPEARQHARQLWDEFGGTREGWSAATARIPVPKAAEPAPRPGSAAEFAAWEKVNKPLPTAVLRDSSGAEWKTAALQGHATFVNVFATWCSPCRDELPSVQKLYELSRQRGDFQVVVLSVDENPGELSPFLAANGYTFPVIRAREYVESVTGPFTIPQNWIVDSKGTLREKSVGFDSRMADWPGRMAEKAIEAAH
jgi:thiol-disulfide isomerase/thioredoxin